MVVLGYRYRECHCQYYHHNVCVCVYMGSGGGGLRGMSYSTCKWKAVLVPLYCCGP